MWHTTFYPPSAASYTQPGRVFMADTHGLAGNTQPFKTISFVLYTFLFLTYKLTTLLAIICHYKNVINKLCIDCQGE